MINYRRLENTIENIVEESSANISVSFYDLDQGEGFSINGDKRVPSASMIKLLILLKALDECDKGKINLEDTINLDDHDKVDGSGILKELSNNHKFSIRELLTLMIIVSDNTATNILIDLLGMEEINKIGNDLGLEKTSLERKMMDSNAREKGLDNFTSSNEILKLLKMIYDKDFVSEDFSDLALDILLRQKERQRLQRYLPEDLKIASKSGDLDNLENDGGIFFTENKNYILVVLVNQAKSNVLAKEIIGEISLKIYKEIGE
ncbi:MAG: serine hydrolase [Peptoniphilus harei]|uniref:serine hydrolase n=1 Tax=Peptoniphilus TaxID=162289 RepID=UPI0008A5A5A1|nr:MULTISPECIES: serine hydrolase [Peptoniphilus]MDU5470899.1 serine hydrolase [Peptoniphilus harei]MDU6099013.1 serine hydrolase [Peptoniphilus harei]OFO62584.1 serine hydrolase [Peptoniphilus sp. HMSC075B08]